MSVAVDTTQGLRPALLGSHDGGRQWYALWFGLPDNRNVVVFPRRIGGAFVSLERPCNDYGGEAHGAGRYGIWSRRSPDLNHWGSARLVASPGLFGDEVTKIGPGAPPIDTIDGWLCIVHLVTSVADEARESRGWEDDWDKRYSLGALLLDRDDPSRVLARSVGPLLEPEADFERFGFRGDVVFPTAAVPVKRGGIEEVWVYYGAADTSIGVAAASVATVLETLVEVGD